MYFVYMYWCILLCKLSVRYINTHALNEINGLQMGGGVLFVVSGYLSFR